MVKVNANLHDESDVGAMCGPTVTVTSGSDGMSVEVGHGFGATALTADEWAAYAARQRELFQVVVTINYANGPITVTDPPQDLRRALEHMHWLIGHDWAHPHSGKRVRVMAQSEVERLGLNRMGERAATAGVSDSDLKASARRIDALRTAADLERDGDQQ